MLVGVLLPPNATEVSSTMPCWWPCSGDLSFRVTQTDASSLLGNSTTHKMLAVPKLSGQSPEWRCRSGFKELRPVGLAVCGLIFLESL